MKKLTIFFSVILMCVAAASSAIAQTITRDVSGYTGIECNGPFNVQIKIDGTESLKLDVDADALNDVITEVEGGVLKVSLKNGWRNHRNVKRANVYITAKQLRYLGNGGSGSTVLDGTVTGENAKLAVSGSGNLKAAVKAQYLELSVSGSGSMNLSGTAANTTSRVSGSGVVDARPLTTQTLAAKISGSGGVTITAQQSVSASISGSGSLAYAGDAQLADTHYSGSGRVNKIN
jgi:hypothetical protein